MRNLLVLIFLIPLLNSCGVYSLTGGSTGNAKTVSIGYFENKATLVNPNLSQQFTEKLKDKFQRETKLSLIQSDGDFDLTGYVSNYVTSPAGVQSGDRPAQNRLTISMHVVFHNKLDAKQDFEQDFSNYSDFDASKSLADVETALVQDITTKLVQDIYTRIVDNW